MTDIVEFIKQVIYPESPKGRNLYDHLKMNPLDSSIKFSIQAKLDNMILQMPPGGAMQYEVNPKDRTKYNLPKSHNGIPIKVNKFIKEGEILLRPFLL